MNIKKLLIVFMLSAFSIACFGNDKKSTVINVNLKGFNTGYIICTTTQIDKDTKVVKPEVADTVIVQNGKAILYPQIDHFSIISMRLEKKFQKYGWISINLSSQITLFAYPNEKIKINAQVFEDRTIDYKLTGNAFNKEYAKYRSFLIPDYRIFNTAIMESPDPTKRTKETQDKINKALKNRKVIENEYYNKHANTPLGAFLYIDNYYYTIRKNTNNDLNIKELGPKAMNSVFGIYCANLVAQEEQYNITQEEIKIKDSLNQIEIKKIAANPAPDFTLKDIKGKDITLSSFRGKYVILDFWFIGCGGCPGSIENLKIYSKKYPEKFEVITINIYDPLNKLQTAVKDLKMNRFINLLDNHETVKNLYKIIAVPNEILIYPDGKLEYLKGNLKRLDELFGNK